MAVTRGFALAMAGRSGAGDAILVLPKVIVCGGACAVVALISLGGTSVRKPSAPIATTAQRPTVASADLYEALFGRRMVDAILATPVRRHSAARLPWQAAVRRSRAATDVHARGSVHRGEAQRQWIEVPPHVPDEWVGLDDAGDDGDRKRWDGADRDEIELHEHRLAVGTW
jgi:hypothetical protein